MRIRPSACAQRHARNFQFPSCGTAAKELVPLVPCPGSPASKVQPFPNLTDTECDRVVGWGSRLASAIGYSYEVQTKKKKKEARARLKAQTYEAMPSQPSTPSHQPIGV